MSSFRRKPEPSALLLATQCELFAVARARPGNFEVITTDCCFCVALIPHGAYNSRTLLRGGAVWQLVALINRRSQVQILPPLPVMQKGLHREPFLIGARMRGSKGG